MKQQINHIKIFILGSFLLAASFVGLAQQTGDIAPYEIEKFQSYLEQCKLQAPNSSTAATASKIKEGYSSEFFYVVDEDKIAFTQSGNKARTELRFLDNWKVSEKDQLFHTKFKIVEQSCDQVTVVQIHDDGNIGNNPNKPLLRIYKHKAKTPANHLWAAIKTDAGGVATKHIDLGEDTGEYFDCDVSIVNEQLVIAINNEEKVNMDVSYWTYESYWKNGVYLQDDGKATAYFDEIYLTTPSVSVRKADISLDSLSQNTKVNLYPNPVKNKVTLEFKNIFGAPLITLYSSTGQLISQEIVQHPLKTFDMGHLKNGVYFFKINGVNPIVKQFVKK